MFTTSIWYFFVHSKLLISRSFYKFSSFGVWMTALLESRISVYRITNICIWGMDTYIFSKFNMAINFTLLSLFSMSGCTFNADSVPLQKNLLAGGYHYCTTSFTKIWPQVLPRFKSCLWRVGDSWWWGSLAMVLVGNKAKRLSSVSHITKTVHHHHNHHNHHHYQHHHPLLFDRFHN